MKSKYRNTSGNILLYVLIGIALFAALMFVISRENRYDTGSTETAALDAQQISSYAEKVNGAVQNLMMQNHCRAAQLGFTKGATGACQVFDQSGVGGGVVFQTPPADAIDTASAASGTVAAGNYIIEGNICVTGAGTDCTSGGSALVFIMPWVTEAVCAQINQIATSSTTIASIVTATFDGTPFTGTFSNTYTLTPPAANTSGCYHSKGSPPGRGYDFFEVLIAN